MYNITICDDEEAFVLEMRKNLARYAEKRGLDFHIRVCYDGQELLGHYTEETDLIILDIRMEKTDGLKAAEEVRRRDKKAGIIFLTSVAEYVWKGYEYGAVNYLLKPLKYERMEMELDRFFASYEGKTDRFLVVTNDCGRFKVPYKELRYLETKARNVLIHYGKQQQIWHKSMKEAARVFETEQAFARCHASFLVNLSYVKSVENMEAVLSTGERIPISHPKRKAFMQSLAAYWGERM